VVVVAVACEPEVPDPLVLQLQHLGLIPSTRHPRTYLARSTSAQGSELLLQPRVELQRGSA
jgi:hypothetical protein